MLVLNSPHPFTTTMPSNKLYKHVLCMWLLPIKDRLSNIKNNYYARRGFKEEVQWLRLKGDERTHEQCQYKDLDNKPLYLTHRVSVGLISRLRTLKKFHINERRSGNKQKNLSPHIGCFKMSLASSNYSDCLSRILYTEYLKPSFFFYSIAKGVASLKIGVSIDLFYHALFSYQSIFHSKTINKLQ